MATASTGFERTSYSRLTVGSPDSWQNDAETEMENPDDLVAESTVAS